MKKSTKKQNIKKTKQPVNTQLNYKFQAQIIPNTETKKAQNTDINLELASIKKDLVKSLGLALLIVISLVVIYWVS